MSTKTFLYLVDIPDNLDLPDGDHDVEVNSITMDFV